MIKMLTGKVKIKQGGFTMPAGATVVDVENYNGMQWVTWTIPESQYHENEHLLEEAG